MSNKRTIKALEDLVKTEYMAVAALDSALEEIEDKKLRKHYRKWRDSHAKQAEALNERIDDLGGEPLEYEVGTGKAQATIWGKLTGLREDSSIAGMRIGAERGIKRYIDNLDDVEDPKALSIIRKNLEAKKDEIDWYDEQVGKEREKKLDAKLEDTSEKAEMLSADGKESKKGGLPFPLMVVLGALGAAAYFLMRKGDDSDYDDYSEDAFRYDVDDTTAHAESTSGENSSSDSYSAGGNGASTDYSSIASTGDMDTAH